MSENTSPDPATKKGRKALAAPEMPPMPAEVIDALGGRPIAVPSMVARRVSTSSPVPGALDPAVPARVTNALFDDPGVDLRGAAKRIREVRAAFGRVALAMDEAARLLRGATALDRIGEAATREGFDLDAAIAVAREFEDFLDRHKPAAPAPDA